MTNQPINFLNRNFLPRRVTCAVMMQVPFEKEHELFPTISAPSATSSPSSGSDPPGSARPGRLVLPAFHEDQDHSLRLIDPAKESDLETYLRIDLSVDSLNKIHKHLWFAGLPQGARALHHQLLIGRKIIIAERADLHLLWRDDRLYLKPMPDYLLSYDVWNGTLLKDRNSFENATGFLLSYLWLIRHKSDFLIAQSENLVSKDVTWEQWTTFSMAIFPNVFSTAFEGISPRYLYGELRLARVNLIYRLCRKTRNSKTFVRGYFYGYHTYSSFVEQNFAWVLTLIVYITIVLTAMQVGLGTTELQSNALFNRASYGFTVFSIMAPLGISFVVFSVLLILIFFNLDYTVKKRYDTRKSFPTVFNNAALQPYNH